MTGVLLIQLGTPDAPTPEALRPYLRQFLSDQRVIQDQGLRWKLILNGIILRTRPAESAAKYARIWDPVTGSPLLHFTRRQAQLLQEQVPGVPVRFGMIVGNPAVGSVAAEMIAAGVDRLIVLPMFPQYSATTTASATDSLFKALQKEQRVPALRIVPPYFDHPAYIDALEAVIRQDLASLAWEPEHFVISYHGLPQSYADRGDPYAGQCAETTRRLVERLGWPADRFTQTFQSRFGREEWLKPYTDDVLTELAARGVKRVAVVLPGFTADCLETLDEIGNESREVFERAGGEHLRAVPCLNDHPKWIEAMAQLIRENGAGWLASPP